MRTSRQVAATVAAAVLAAAVVLGVHFHRRNASASERSAAVSSPVSNGVTPAHPAALDAHIPKGYPQGLTPPQLPAYIRDKAEPPQLPANLPDAAEMHEQFVMLKKFLELPPEKLERIRQSIERIQQIPPDRKQEMLDRIRNVVPVSPEQEARNANLLAEAPEAVRVRIDSMPDAEKEVLLNRLAAFDAVQRKAFFEGMETAENTFMPW